MVRSAAPPRVSNHESRDLDTSLLRAKLFDFGVAWQIVAALAIDRIHHHALAVLLRGLADVSTEGRLVVDLAEGDLAQRRRHRQSLGRCNQLLRIGRTG